MAAAMILICTATGCRRTSHNGKIDGYWQVEYIEDLTTGNTIECFDRYVAINLELVQLYKGGGLYGVGYLRYDKGDDEFAMDFPDVPGQNNTNNLAIFGVYENPQRYDIVKLNSKEFVYKSDRVLVHCRRY